MINLLVLDLVSLVSVTIPKEFANLENLVVFCNRTDEIHISPRTIYKFGYSHVDLEEQDSGQVLESIIMVLCLMTMMMIMIMMVVVVTATKNQ